jgi:tetratricopeptide (TPR) repeat protein
MYLFTVPAGKPCSKLYLVCLLSILFLPAACSSIPPKSEDLPELSRKKLLQVPFYPQTQYFCGPASLAGIFHYREQIHSPDEIAKWVYLPGRKGSLQVELSAAVRRTGLLPYPIDGSLKALLLEIDAGNPVLVLQNNGFNWWPQWHYAIATGYDLQSAEMILHSGTKANYKIAITTFEKTWQRANNWGLVIIPPSLLPARADARTFIKAATDLESVGQTEAAFLAYQSAHTRWPENPVALMGIGNITYARQQYAQSVAAFLELARLEADNPFAWNNLAYALNAYGCPQGAIKAIKKALDFAGNDARIQSSKRELENSIKTGSTDNNHCIVPDF